MGNEFLRECQILKTNQFDAFNVWNKLEVAVPLHLEADGDKGIVVQFWDEDDKRYTIGKLAKEDVVTIDKFVEANWQEVVFDCFLSKCDKAADESKRFNVAIFLKNNDKYAEVGNNGGNVERKNDSKTQTETS